MKYTDNAIKAAARAGKAWRMAARAMRAAQAASTLRNPSNAADMAQEAAVKCAEAAEEAGQYSIAAYGGDDYGDAEFAARAACYADNVARRAAKLPAYPKKLT
jgi:hypothetical protein